MNNLERHVLRLIGENVSSPDVFVDTSDGLEQIRDSLNDAVEELCMVTGTYKRKYLITLHEERALYRLTPVNDDIGWVIAAWDRENHRPLRQTDILSMSSQDDRFLETNGTPTYWYQMGNQHIGFWPRPGSKGRVIELDCICVPKPYSHGQGPIRLKAQYERGAVFRAVSDFFASRGDAKRAGEWLQQYLEVSALMNLNPQTAERQYRFGGYNRPEAD